MARIVKGEVVTLPFPFSNLAGSKKRPALVISDPMGDDVLLCQITASRNDAYTIELGRSDFSTGSLPINPSFIRPNKIFTADCAVIIDSKGTITAKKYGEVCDSIIRIISP